MPERTFSIFDATLVGATDSPGLVQVSLPTGSAQHTITSLLSLVTIFGYNCSINFTGQRTTIPSTNVSSVSASGGSFINQEVEINYLEPVFGLPANCKVKKMVFRIQQSINATASAAGTFAFGTLEVGATSTFRFNITQYGHELGFNEVDPPTNSVSLTNSFTTGDNIIIFDYTGTDTFIPRDEFVTDYSRITHHCTIFARASNAQATTSGQTTTLTYNLTTGPDWSIIVEYELASISWTLGSPPANRTVQPGDIIEFTSNPLDENPLDFTQIETITIDLLDEDGNVVGEPITVEEVYWIDVLPNLLRFIIPEDFDQSVLPVTCITRITSTQFEGTVDLQEFYVIYFYNAPGVYTLVKGRKHDTYYDTTVDPVSTIDTKIPDPTGRTGYY